MDDGAGDPGNEIEEEKLEPGTNGDPVSDFETPGHEIEEDIDLDVAIESPDQNTNIDDTGHPNKPSMDTDGKPFDAAEVNNPELGMLGKENILAGKTYFVSSVYFYFTAAGVVSRGSRKKPPRTSSIVQIIFYFSPLRSEDIF